MQNESTNSTTPGFTANRGKRFIKDFGIYTLGNLGMKLITLMLVLYTYVHDPGDYGYFDLCLMRCIYVATHRDVRMRDGSFRFLINNKDETYRQHLISLCTVHC